MEFTEIYTIPERVNRKYWQNFLRDKLLSLYFPLLYWIKTKVEEASISSIYFCSRDGYILYWLWKMLKLDSLSKPVYLPISRDAMRLYSAVFKDESEKTIYDILRQIDVRFTLKQEEDVLKILSKWTGSKINSLEEGVNKLSTLAFRYKNYVQRIGLLDNKVQKAIFDLGWGGTVMYYLEKLVGKLPSTRFLYVGLRDSTPKSVLERAETFAFSPTTNTSLRLAIMEYLPVVEFVFSAPHGRFLRLDEKYNPIWDDIFPLTKEVLNLFISELEKVVKEKVYQPFFRNISPEDAFSPLLEFARKKTLHDLKEWSKVALEINIDGRYFPFVPTFTKEDLFSRKKHVKKIMSKALWWNTLYIKGVNNQKEFEMLLKEASLYKRVYAHSRFYFKLQWILSSISWRNFKRFLRSPLETLKIVFLRVFR